MTRPDKARAALFVLLLTLATPLPAAGETGLLDAHAAFIAGDHETALPLWRGLADEGDPEAAFLLAEAYLNGPPAIANRTLAFDWYRIAARLGHVEARFALGEQHMIDGEGLWPDEDAEAHFAEAAHWLALAAEAGYAPARHQLGRLHLNGAGVPEDLEATRRLWTLAAAQGHRDSYDVLELFGFAVPEETLDIWTRFDTLMATGNRPDPDFVARLLLPMAEAGHMLAQYRLGIIHFAARAQPGAPEAAERWLSAALAQGMRPARLLLVTLALERAGPGPAR